MGHSITALLAKTAVIDPLLEGRSLIAVDLRDGWKLVPLEDDDLDSLGLDFSVIIEGFIYLSPSLSEFLAQLSRHGPLAYVEADYFGGAGSQGAASFANGAAIAPTPITGEGSINSALQSIGIKSTEDCDEFDYIGLSRHRRTEDWKDTDQVKSTEASHPP